MTLFQFRNDVLSFDFWNVYLAWNVDVRNTCMRISLFY